MQIVAARACDDIHRGPVGQARGKVEVHGGDLKLLDYFLRKAHGGAAVADGHNAASINRNARTATAVAHCLTQNRHERAVVAPPRCRRRAGLELCQFQKVPAIQREAFGLSPCDDARYLIGVIAKLWRGAAHGDCFGRRADMHGEIDRRGGTCFDKHLAAEALESRRFGEHFIDSRGQSWRAVVPFGRGYELAARLSLLVRDYDAGSENRRSGGVSDDARYGLAGRLRVHRCECESDDLRSEVYEENLFHCSPVQQRSLRQADAPQQVPKPGVGAERHESLIYVNELHVGVAQFDGLIEPLEGFILQPKLGIVCGGPDQSCAMQSISVEKNSFRFWITRGGIFSLDSCSQLFCTAIFHFLRKRRRALQPVFGSPECGEQLGESFSFHALALISQSHTAMSWVTHRAAQGGYFTVLGECLIITTRRRQRPCQIAMH